MRVLLISHQYFPRHTGGTEVVVRGLAQRLKQSGHEPVVLSVVEAPSTCIADHGLRVTTFDGVPLWELSCNLGCAPHPARAEYDHALNVALVLKAAERIAPDVIHVAHPMKLGATIVPRLREAGFPVVVMLADYWALCMRHTLMKPDHSLCVTGPDNDTRCIDCARATHQFAKDAKALERDASALAQRVGVVRAALLRANRLIALSHFLKRKLAEHGYPPERIEVIQHGIDIAPLEQARASGHVVGSTRRVVFMGTLAAHKGPHILLEALRAVPHANVRVDFYGAPGVDSAYVARLHALSRDDARVRFMGLIPPECLGEAFIDADAFALPALWYENDPLVVKAALYARVPVAASRIGSLEELLGDQRLGWLLPAGDASAWAAWLESLVERVPPRIPADIEVTTADAFFTHILDLYQSLA